MIQMIKARIDELNAQGSNIELLMEKTDTLFSVILKSNGEVKGSSHVTLSATDTPRDRALREAKVIDNAVVYPLVKLGIQSLK